MLYDYIVCSCPAMSRHLGCEAKHVAHDSDGNFVYDPFQPYTTRNAIKMC